MTLNEKQESLCDLHFDTESGGTHRSYSIANPPRPDGKVAGSAAPAPAS